MTWPTPPFTKLSRDLIAQIVVSCIDCGKTVLGNANTKRCVSCRKEFRRKCAKVYRQERARKHNQHERTSYRNTPGVYHDDLPQIVTDKQIVAYLRSFRPADLSTIISDIRRMKQEIRKQRAEKISAD